MNRKDVLKAISDIHEYYEDDFFVFEGDTLFLCEILLKEKLRSLAVSEQND